MGQTLNFDSIFLGEDQFRLLANLDGVDMGSASPKGMGNGLIYGFAAIAEVKASKTLA